MKPKIKALVAVRSGSQRVKNKNIRPFAGSTLLEVKIRQLKKIKELDGIVVNPVGLKGIFKDWVQSEGEEPE